MTVEEEQFVNPVPRKHLQHLTYQHWQLRDLLTCPETSEEVYFVRTNSILKYNTLSKETIEFQKSLPFEPTSLTSSHGFLAAGGNRSQLLVRELNSGWKKTMSVGGSINNALCISQHSEGPCLLVCNNDETIKVYSLPELHHLFSIPLPTAVNYASVSPDGTKLVAVGDSTDAYLFAFSRNGYVRSSTFKVADDGSFSCAWNQSGNKFAVASQDGSVSVWDIRSNRQLCRLGSRQASSRSQRPSSGRATRCVKFSPSGSDLLMYTEHTSNFHVVDARHFDTVQSIRIGPPGADCDIVGATFSPDSQVLFVGIQNAILEYEVDTVGRRCFPAGTIV
ncbi:uncharacterized protein VTP21DRAFT_6484 [Calcarisporiella thermophila]|uniref:uncharacterized protein n=1 Tax=Calcarisporiella thermophila TaxID=911321 RepID=UPI0037422EA1